MMEQNERYIALKEQYQSARYAAMAQPGNADAMKLLKELDEAIREIERLVPQYCGPKMRYK